MEHILLPDFPGIPTVFSHATKIPATASLVFCSGQIPSREVDNSLAGETTRERTEIVLQGLEKVLVAAGSSLKQLVKVNVYITDFAFFDEMNEVYSRMIPDPKPARTCVCVKALPRGATLEIEATGWAA